MSRIIKISIFIFAFNIIFSEEYSGYLREIDMSFCMDDCSNFYLESEEGEYISNISFNSSFPPDSYINRYIHIEGEEIWCVECGAIEVEYIELSTDCNFPVFCFADPCEVAEECQINTPVECVSNYCGGCYADFYDLNGNLVDCYNPTNLGDINEDGILNVLDLVLMIDMILNNEYSLIADVNEDGIVNILDIVQLVNVILNN